jgi:acetyltransferase-like isoleucine patch superfamily enzyme
LGGHVTIGELSAVSIGATIKNRITIGRHTVIGAGALVLKDIGDGVLAYGVPAHVVRPRRPDEPYL